MSNYEKAKQYLRQYKNDQTKYFHELYVLKGASKYNQLINKDQLNRYLQSITKAASSKEITTKNSRFYTVELFADKQLTNYQEELINVLGTTYSGFELDEVPEFDGFKPDNTNLILVSRQNKQTENGIYQFLTHGFKVGTNDLWFPGDEGDPEMRFFMRKLPHYMLTPETTFIVQQGNAFGGNIYKSKNNNAKDETRTLPIVFEKSSIESNKRQIINTEMYEYPNHHFYSGKMSYEIQSAKSNEKLYFKDISQWNYNEVKLIENKNPNTININFADSQVAIYVKDENNNHIKVGEVILNENSRILMRKNGDTNNILMFGHNQGVKLMDESLTTEIKLEYF